MHLDIIRSNQKDAQYVEMLRSELAQSLSGLFENRQLPFRHGVEISLAAALVYYGLSTVRGYQTLGEEYCEILPVHNLAKPSLGRRIMVSLLESVPSSLRKMVVRNISGDERVLSFVENLMDDFFVPLNLAMFYYCGKFYQISKRLAGIDYIYQSKYILPRVKRSYKILALLILIQIILRLSKITAPWQSVPKQESTVSAGDKTAGYSCSLCLLSLKTPSVTSCGHVFCWNCIMQWALQSGNECPLCRQTIYPSQVVLLQNFT